MAVDPRVEVCLIETPAFVEADLSKPVADHFLFEAIAREAATFCGLVEVENTFFRHATPQRVLQMVSDGPGKCRQVDEI